MLHGDILWFFRLRLFLQRLAGSMAGAVTLLGPNFRWTFEARRRCGSRRAPCCTGLRPAVPRLENLRKLNKNQQHLVVLWCFMWFCLFSPPAMSQYVTSFQAAWIMKVAVLWSPRWCEKPRLKDITSHHQDKLNVGSFVDELAKNPGFAKCNDFSRQIFWGRCC